MSAVGPVEVIAIDGPSGTGKSTVARAVARALGWRYLDTGAMYRAATWAVLRAGVPAEDATPVVRDAVLTIGTDPGADGAALDVSVDGTPVTAEIRSPEVTAAVSAVSAVSAVRDLLVRGQRELIGAGRIVVEGRDIGSVVVPDARLKIYLTAQPEVRVARRAQETGGEAATVGEAMSRRDAYDTGREASPLRAAPHAVVLDTSQMSQDEVVEHILSLARLVV